MFQKLVLSAVWFALVMFPFQCFAQFESASVLGTIRDATGAAVPGALVQLRNQNTGVSFSSLTSTSGDYQFFNVRPGDYRVTVELPGFAKTVSELFSVAVASRQRVDLTLQLEQRAEVINVVEAAAPVETDTSARQTVIRKAQAVALPLNGRSYADLSLLTPGVVQAQVGVSGQRNASYHVNGMRSSYNNFLLDGLDNNAYGTSNQGFSNQVVQLSPDAVDEFSVTTNNFSAEYGRAGGAVINATLRSGTNQIHFSSWEYLRNKALNATGFFKPVNNQKPNLIQNQFGAALGGPVKRDRAFYFLDYEGFRRVQSQLTFASLPSGAAREGKFDIAVSDPYTGVPYPNNTIPQTSITPLARKVLADLPQPNRPGTGNPAVGNNFESLPRAVSPDNKGDVRLDQYWSQRLTSFVRYSHRELNSFEPPAIPGPSGGNSNGNVRVMNRSLALGATFAISAGALLETRFGSTRTEGGKTPVNFGEPHAEDTYGITGLPRDPRIGGGLNSQSVSGFSAFGRQSSNPQFQNPSVLNPRINLSVISGKHTLKAGYEHQRINTEINDLAPVYGASSYAGQFSRPAGAAANNLYNLADFLVGAQSSLSKSVFDVLQYRQRMHFGYLQDDWKLHPRLTLNLGVRYEFATPQWEDRNRLGNFNPMTGQLFFAKPGGLYERSTIYPDKNNWAPRVGLAFQVDRQTSLRAAYGISYIHVNRMGGENILGFTGPFYFTVTRNQVPSGVTGGLPTCQVGQDFTTCFLRTQDGFPSDFTDPKRYDTRLARVNYIPSDTPAGYVQSWHFTIQRALPGALLLDLGYVGNRGVHQLILGDFNQAHPNQPGQNIPLQSRRPYRNYDFIQIAFAGGNTFYHAFQAKIERKMEQGLFLINSFTWSKAIDNAPGHLEVYNGDNSRVNFRNLASERGLSSYDVPVSNVTSLIWELPVGRGKRFGRSLGNIGNGVFGGWRLTAINTARSGLPVNVYYSPASAFQVCSSCTPRPNVTGPIVSEDKNIAAFFIKSNIQIPTDVSRPFGNLGRNVARSHGYRQLDLGISKWFSLTERVNLEFRSELFNALNGTNFAAPASRADSSDFGRITSTFPARQVQFALRLQY